jgi:opacity protein-like surface antigen
MKQSVKADWIANMLARAGWGEDRWLAFVTGGVAVTRLEIDYRFDDGTAFEARSRSSEHEVRVGWTLGLGGEYAFDERWSIRGQYLYTNFGTMETVTPVTSLHANQSDLEDKASLQSHTALIGVSYRF